MSGPPHPSYLCPVAIGRATEITRLREALTGAGSVLLISGEAGLGKSRLVREARAIADAAGTPVAEGRVFETDRSLPFAPAIDLLRALVDRHGAAEIARLAGPAANAISRLLPEITPSAPESNAEDVDPETAKRRLLDGVARIVGGLAAGEPLLVIVEDIHWSDASGLSLLLHLARHAPRDGVILLMTYRSDEVHPDLEHLLANLDRERLATEIALERLDAGQVAQMLQAIFNAPVPAPATLLHAIYALTEGNPFFVEEVLSTLGREQPLLTPDGSWARGDLLHLRIPRSIHDAVRRRLDGLSATARGVLVLAAVAGRRFEFDLLSELSGHDEGELLVVMKELIAAQLVVEEADDRFAFRHALTREAIYAGLLDRERRWLHQRVAETIARLYGSDTDQRLDDLAWHAFASGSWQSALSLCRRAGARASALHAPRAAVEHLSRAIEASRMLGHGTDMALHRERGRAHETLGEFERALADYQVALDSARVSGARRDTWQCLLDLALLWASRDYERTGEFVTRALDVARDLNDPSAIAHSLNRVANWHSNIEQPSQAAHFHREALAIFEDLRDHHGIAETLDLLGITSLMSGEFAVGIEAYARAEPFWRTLGDHRGLASALIGLGMLTHSFHAITHPVPSPNQTARDASKQATALCQKIGWRAGEAWALWVCQGMTLGACGEYDVALPATRQALQIAREIEHRQWIVGARCMLGNMAADLGDFPSARSELEAALALAREINSPYWIRSAAGWLGTVLTRASAVDDATGLLEQELDASTPLNTLAGRLLWLAAADLALAQGEPESALRHIDRLMHALPPAQRRPVARLEQVRGAALMTLDRADDAEASLLRAREAAEWSGAQPLLWRIDGQRAHLYSTMGRGDEAVAAREQAQALVDTITARVPDRALRESFVVLTNQVLAPSPPGPDLSREPPTSPLTNRELEVAMLLTEGLTNREIGQRLYLSEWTVATHVRNILGKLDLSSRTQIAAWAVDHRTTRGA